MARHDTDAASGSLRLTLRPDQLTWLAEAGGAQSPPLDAAAMLGTLVDEAMQRVDDDTQRRAERAEIYAVTGYREHHPDYPDVPPGLSDV
jgi:hypothetical protein